MQKSSKRTPCPVCGRDSDGDCRWSNEVIFCHNGSSFAPPQHLKVGDVLNIEGIPFALVKINGGYDGSAHVFKPDKKRVKSALPVRYHKSVQAISDQDGLDHKVADFRILARQCLAAPPLQELLDREISDLHDETQKCFAMANKLLVRLKRASAKDKSLLYDLENTAALQRQLRFQLKELEQYCKSPGKYFRQVLAGQSSELMDLDLTFSSDYAFWSDRSPAYKPKDPIVAELHRLYLEGAIIKNAADAGRF
jgi:hypothetical protein